MEEPKQKLAKLEELIPDTFDLGLLYDFGRFLAGYLNSELVPIGFVIGCELALRDLQRGVSGSTKRPIQSQLVGYPPGIYSLLRMEIPRIADAVFPAEFASGVKIVLDEIETKMEASRRRIAEEEEGWRRQTEEKRK